MTYYGTLTDTLLINGSDLQAVDGLVIGDLSGLLNDAPYRGENVTLPGRPGVLSYEKVRDAYTFDIPVALIADSRAGYLTVLNAVRALMGGSNLVTLTRVLTGAANTTCSAEYVAGTAIDSLNHQNGRTVLQFVNLTGEWV